MSKARDLSAFVSTPTNAGSSVKLKEGSDNGSNFIELKSPASLAGDVTFVLPNADGTNGQALTTNGSGALAWSTVGGTPGGSDTQIQYNNAGSFAGASGLVTDGSNLTLNAQGDLRFADSDSSNWVALQAPATIASNVTWTLPDADGTDGQVIKTNGSGTLSWITPATGGGGGGGTSVTVTQITATASQTDFSVTYTVGQLSVYLNGALLSSSDYTATNGTSVVLASGAASGDIFTAVAYDSATQITVGDSKVEVTDTGSDGTATFTLDNTVRAKVNQYGIGLGTETPSSGMGIKFPVTQSASSDANTLDDYEEGTWTPAYKQTDGTPIAENTPNASTYKYTKIGNIVCLTYHYAQQTGAMNNVRRISGLPFSCQSGAGLWFSLFPYGSALSNTVGWEAQINNGAVEISFQTSQTLPSAQNYIFTVTYFTTA